VLANDEGALRSFCARILGWTTNREAVVEHAIRSLELATDHSAALVLLGETDLVPIAHALHRRMLGAERPFIVADRRRGNTSESVRSPPNYVSGVGAFEAASGGSLCVSYPRLPPDFSSVVALVRDLNVRVQLMICADARFATHPFLTLPAPIRVPSLRTRTKELPRIIAEYAADAIAELNAPSTCFTEADRQWIIDHNPWALPEIEKATLRLVALRDSKNLSRAAERLGMAPVSLSRWLDRRRLQPTPARDLGVSLQPLEQHAPPARRGNRGENRR
jgi:hypothetical protein